MGKRQCEEGCYKWTRTGGHCAAHGGGKRYQHDHRKAHAPSARRSWAASVLLLCAVAISLPTFAQAYEKGSIEFFDFYG